MLKSAIFFLLLTFPLSRLYSQEVIPQYHLKGIRIPNIGQNVQLLNQNKLLNFLNNFITLPKTSFASSKIIDSVIVSTTDGFKNKITFDYTESNRIASYTIYVLQNNLWQIWEKTANSYDSLGNVISTIFEEWNGSDWVNYSGEFYTYDSNFRIVSYLIKNWDTNGWVNSVRTSNSYFSGGDSSISISKKWVDSSWVSSFKSTKYYYPNNLSSSVSYKNFSNGNWKNYILMTVNYDDNWNLISILSKKWNGSTFRNYVRVTFDYLLNKQTIEMFEVWDNSKLNPNDDWMWIKNSRYLYNYNSDNYYEKGLYQYWANNQWVAGDGNLYIENPDGFKLSFLANTALIYYNKLTDIKNNEKIYLKDYEAFQNYPNPFNPTTTIKYQIPESGFVNLTIYNMLGQKIKTLVNKFKAAGKYQVEFNAVSTGGGLPSGIYVYKIKAGNFSASKKMILLK